RRIDQSHRLLYSIQYGEIIIYAARYHYGDK
ncbi:type II toxin-antitoxin system YoeB family toxin, partial [Escherichia coli]